MRVQSGSLEVARLDDVFGLRQCEDKLVAGPETERIVRQFADPAQQHRPIAWWMLNGDLKPEIMRRHLAKFKRFGFGGMRPIPAALNSPAPSAPAKIT